MNRECDGTDYPGGQPPSDSHLIGCGRICGRSECDADDRVHHTYEYRCSEPSLTTRCIHCVWPDFGIDYSLCPTILCHARTSWAVTLPAHFCFFALALIPLTI